MIVRQATAPGPSSFLPAAAFTSPALQTGGGPRAAANPLEIKGWPRPLRTPVAATHTLGVAGSASSFRPKAVELDAQKNDPAASDPPTQAQAAAKLSSRAIAAAAAVRGGHQSSLGPLLGGPQGSGGELPPVLRSQPRQWRIRTDRPGGWRRAGNRPGAGSRSAQTKHFG